MILEFIGLPGAGKSTLATALASRLASDLAVDLPDRFEYRRKSLTLSEKLRLDVAYPGFLPYRLGRLHHDVRRFGLGLWTVRNSWKRSRYPLVLLDRTARLPRQFHVLDEWLLHRTIDESILRYESDVTYSTKFAIPPLAPHRLTYVCVNVDRDEACARVRSQEQPFRTFAKERDTGRIQETLAVWSRQLEALKAEIRGRGFELIEVDGRAPVDANIALLEDRLRRFTGTGDESHQTHRMVPRS